VIAAELLHGATAGVVLPGIAAITLGIVGRQNMSLRIGRNYRYGAAGNSLTAAAMGLLGAYVSQRAIFIATAILCIPALLALSRINADEIDYVRARNATKRDHDFDLQRTLDLVKNRNLVVFAGCMVLFHKCIRDAAGWPEPRTNRSCITESAFLLLGFASPVLSIFTTPAKNCCRENTTTSAAHPRALTTCACCCASLVCALLCAVACEHAWRASETFPETGSAPLRGSSLHFPRPNVWVDELMIYGLVAQ
jgi:hypothetical protein